MPNQLAAKSESVWAAGKRHLELGDGNSAANRLYYGLFLAVKGYAVFKGKMAMTETQKVHAAALDVVCPKGAKTRKTLYRSHMQELSALRVTADYLVEDVELEDLRELVTKVEGMRNDYLNLLGEEK
jgi:uncharacterized protein (UPF0332 family)